MPIVVCLYLLNFDALKNTGNSFYSVILEYQHYVEEDEDYELYRADSFDRFCRRGSPDDENKSATPTPPPVEKAEEGFWKVFNF